MAGHFLATVNPEAAAAIKPAAPPVLPKVGQLLRYHPRPGEGRGGLTEFSMLVTRVSADGLVDGISFFDAMDFRDLRRLPQRTDANPWPSWDWLEKPDQSSSSAVKAHDDEPRMSMLQNRQQTLISQLSQLAEQMVALALKMDSNVDSIGKDFDVLVTDLDALVQRVSKLEVGGTTPRRGRPPKRTDK